MMGLGGEMRKEVRGLRETFVVGCGMEGRWVFGGVKGEFDVGGTRKGP